VPNLVTVVGRNTHLLPHMIKHYSDIVDDLYVVVYRQDENDTILQEVEECGVVPYKVVTEPKYDWSVVTSIYNQIKLEKPNDWWIVSDDDELQVYPDSLENIIRNCENNGYKFVTGGFLDRIGVDGTFPEVKRDTDIHKTFPYAGHFRHPMSGACPNKVTLMKGDIQVTPGQHYARIDGEVTWGDKHPLRMPIEQCFTQVHHFKWDSSVLERLLEVAETKTLVSFHKEYNKMYRAIARSDFKIDIKNSEYFVEKLKNFSYIDYNDYPHWDKLRDIIVKI